VVSCTLRRSQAVPSAADGRLWALNGRRGDLLFYGLLASAWIVAGALALRTLHGHPAPHHPTTRGRTSVTTARIALRNQASATTMRRRTRVRRARDINVTITASRGRSWIVVRSRSSKGPIRYEGILEQWHTLGEHGRTLWTEIGAVENVDVRVNGHVVQLGRSALGGRSHVSQRRRGRHGSGPVRRRRLVIAAGPAD